MNKSKRKGTKIIDVFFKFKFFLEEDSLEKNMHSI